MVLMRYDSLIKEEDNDSMIVNIHNDIELASINNLESYSKPVMDKKIYLNNASNIDVASTNLDSSSN